MGKGWKNLGPLDRKAYPEYTEVGRNRNCATISQGTPQVPEDRKGKQRIPS